MNDNKQSGAQSIPDHLIWTTYAVSKSNINIHLKYISFCHTSQENQTCNEIFLVTYYMYNTL